MQRVNFRLPAYALLAAVAVGALVPRDSLADAVSVTVPGDVIQQDFNTLGNSPNNTTQPWNDGATLPGWYFVRNNGTGVEDYRIFNGTAARQNELLSLGQADDPDRALGFQTSSASGSVHYGLRLVNDGGMILDGFQLAYTGEQWRAVNSSGPSEIVFSYQVFDAGNGDLRAASGWTEIGDLKFIAPRYHSSSSDNTGLDGNDPANRAELYGVATDMTWAPGQELWLRWTDIQPPHQMMGIDDVWLRAVPEPGNMLLLLAGGMAMLTRRRRCQTW
ncbi:MAG: PEP-CTERM sorting domain-containing protein [Thermoguttaceae bacterium]|jgi:hypothetical protein|nr:PEP-CTERM sorting domain-containing protein [Thermoguttaceae bacterium]